jgi:predicted transcriptional regulator
MAQSTAKDLLKEAAERLPENASVEDAMERVLFLAKVERGKADAEAGRTISHDDVKRRLGL